MGRPRLPIGGWGEITYERAASGKRVARARFRGPDGLTRTYRRVGSSNTAARNALMAAFREMADAGPGAVLSRGMLVAELASAWLEESRGRLADQTVLRYGEIIDGPIRARFAQVTVAECTVTRVDQGVKAIAGGHGAATAKLARSVLKGALGMAVRHGLLTGNPVRDIAPISDQPAGGDGLEGVRVLTPAEVGVFRAAAIAWEHGKEFRGLAAAAQPATRRRSDIADVIDVLLGTGMRIGEVLALRWQDLDLAEATVVVTGTIVSSDDGLRRQPRTKSGQARGLRMPGFLVATLMRRRTDLVADNELGLVFGSRAGGPRDPSNVRSVIRRIRAGIGLDWVTPHTFRRTVASAIPELADAALQLGHAGTRVTEKHYRARDLSGPDVAAILQAYAETPRTQK